jgi:hypothetical protein
MSEKTLLATITGELFQPVRLHYQVFDREALLRVFRKLRCVERDPSQLRWVWLYDFEARGLSLLRSHAEIPKQLHPVVIGSFYPRGEDRIDLDLRSCERAVQAIPFFDQHIPRKVAKVTEAEHVNRLFSAEEAHLTPDMLFDRQQTPVADPEAFVEKLTELAASALDPAEKYRITMEYINARAKNPLPEIERYPIHYYEEGIQSFENSLRLRQILAHRHWQGNTQCTLYDVIHEAVQGRR